MSGTSFGTVVLHVSPEAAIGGVLGIIQDGDIISLDVPNRLLNVKIADEEIERRLAISNQFSAVEERGYVHLYQKHVEQAHLGADFDFLKGMSGSIVTLDSH